MTTYPTLLRFWMSSLSFPNSQKTWPQTSQVPGPASLQIRPPSCSASLCRPPVQISASAEPALPSSSSALAWLCSHFFLPILGVPSSPVGCVSSKHPQSLSQACPHLAFLPCQDPVGSSHHSLPFHPLIYPSVCWSRVEASSLPELPPTKKEEGLQR